MDEQIGIGGRLWRQVVPSVGQALLMLVLGLAAILVSQSQTILQRLGVSQAGIMSTQTTLSDRTHQVLVSAFAANLALIVFWATIGLVAYLVCWGAYNIVLELRNEVTLAAGYTNHGHWQGAPQTLALKFVCVVGLILTLLSLKYGFSFWLAISAGALSSNLSVGGIFDFVVAVVGVAVQLYLVLVFVQLSFTPWYTPGAFTAE